MGAPIEDARLKLRQALTRAAAVLVEMLDAKDDRIRLRVAEAILNRAGVTQAGAQATWIAEKEVGGEAPYVAP